MPLVQTLTYTLTAPDADGVCASQTTGGAGNLLLNGALVDAVSGTFKVTDKCPKLISATSAGNLSGVTITMSYRATRDGDILTQSRTGPNANTVLFAQYVYELINLAVDGAVGTAITVGTSDAAISHFVMNQAYSSKRAVSVEISSGTVTVSLQHTLSDVLNLYNTNTFTEATAAWIDNDAVVPLVGLTSGQTVALYECYVSAFRLKVTAYSGTPTVILRINEANNV